MGGVSGLKEASKNSVKHFMRRGDPAGARITRPARDSFHMLRRVSEIFEEATRTGIAMKAVKRAEKGKKYTFTRSLDDAIGGMSGWGRMIYDAEHRAGAAKRYKASRFVGAKQQKAALAAKKAGKAELDQDMVDEIRNITLDFQRRGHTGEILNAYYPFLNAELQDYARFTKAMAEAPLSTMMRGFAFVSLPAIANWYMNFDNPLYHQQSDIEKELFLHPFGYDPKYKKFGRIPRPVGSVSGFFSLMPHKILDYLARNDPAAIKALEETMWPGKSMRDARNQFQESMYEATEPMPGWLTGAVGMGALGNFPLAGFPEPTGERMEVGGDPLIKDQPALEYAQENLMDYLATNTAARYLMPEDGTLGSIMNTAAPQFAAPFQHLLSNRDPYFRSPIEPPGMANKNLLAADRFTEHTSPIEHFISKMIPWETSPIQAGHMIRRTTGSLGSALLAGSDALGRATGVFDERPGVPKDATDIHGPGAFFGKEPFGSNSSPVRELYQLWDKNEQVWNSLKHNFDLDTKSGAARGSEIMQAYPDWAAAEILKVAVEDMSALHKERREVKSDMDIPDEQRAAILFEIDQYMTQQAYLALEAYNSIIRNPGLAESIINELNE